MEDGKLGKYEISGILGKGAMGTVYDARDPVIDRRVAIKTLTLPNAADTEAQEELARFKREAQAAGRLTHPNIVGVFDYGETDKLAYIVMEFVDGPSLKSLLDKNERFLVAESVRIMEALLAGLQFSHERGVVHRDIKPANIMLTRDGQVKIADFGIARIESSSMTQAGTIMGTPAYMSPEQFMGQTVDARTDIYSAGVVLYQMLTGERPFEGSMTAIMHKVLNVAPPRPSELSVTVPEALDGVVARAMAKRPEQRFASASDFAQALKAAFEGQCLSSDVADTDATMVSVPPPSAPPRPVATPATAPPPAELVMAKRSRAPLLAGISLLVLAAAGAGWYWFSGRTPLPPPIVSNAPTEPIAPAAPKGNEPPPPAPPPSPAQLRSVLQTATGSVPCAVIEGDVADDGTITVTGLASRAAETNLRQLIAEALGQSAVNWRITHFDGPFCPALDTIRPAARQFGASGPDVQLALKTGPFKLHENDNIVPRLVMPDYPGHVQLTYITSDGSLVHLYPSNEARQIDVVPRSGRPQSQRAQPMDSQTFPAGAVVFVGDPETCHCKPGEVGWQVADPFGTDMMIVAVSDQPLFPQRRPAEDTVETYLRDLQAAMSEATRRGVRVNTRAILVETEPR